MGKLIFWLIVFFVVLLALRLVNVAKTRDRRQDRREPPKPAPPAPMVRCVECGVFLPRVDAHPVPEGFHCGQVNCAQHRTRSR